MVCSPSVSGSGGEKKFRRGPGLVSPEHGQQYDENGEFDVSNKTPPGATETSHLTSRSCRRRRSSQPLQSAGQIPREIKLYIYCLSTRWRSRGDVNNQGQASRP